MTARDRDDSPPSDRDAALERAWRETSTEQPPSHLDAAILAAARKSVAARDGQSGAGPVPGRMLRWVARRQPLLAAAAVTGLALALVPMLPREHEPAPAIQERPSTSAPAAAPVPGTLSAPEHTAVVKPAPSAAPVPAPSESRAESYAREREATADMATTFGQAASPPDAATWVARIEALHAAGEIDAAARELHLFRAAEPEADAYLPEPLRDWARTVEPFPSDPGR